jgi:hypothetical protein
MFNKCYELTCGVNYSKGTIRSYIKAAARDNNGIYPKYNL